MLPVLLRKLLLIIMTGYVCYAQTTTTVQQQRNVMSLAKLMCGHSHSCLHIPQSDMFVAYRPAPNSQNDTLNVLLIGTKAEWLKQRHPNEDNWALTVGFGRTPGMPNTFMISCIHDGVEETPVWHVFGEYSVYRKIPRHISAITRLISNARMALDGETMRCSFSIPTTLAARNDSIDLKRDAVYMKLGRTYAAAACIGYHYQDKYISEETLMFGDERRNLSIIDYTAFELAATAKNKSAADILPKPITIKLIAQSENSHVPKLSEVAQNCGITGACVSLPAESHLLFRRSLADLHSLGIDQQKQALDDENKCDVIAQFHTSTTGNDGSTDGIAFSLVARRPANLPKNSGWYVGIGISNTPSMEHSALFICKVDDVDENVATLTTALGFANAAPEFLAPNATQTLVADHAVVLDDDRMMCNFTTNGMQLALRSATLRADNSNYYQLLLDLRRSHFLIMARGKIVDGRPQYHGANRVATKSKVSLLFVKSR